MARARRYPKPGSRVQPPRRWRLRGLPGVRWLARTSAGASRQELRGSTRPKCMVPCISHRSPGADTRLTREKERQYGRQHRLWGRGLGWRTPPGSEVTRWSPRCVAAGPVVSRCRRACGPGIRPPSWPGWPVMTRRTSWSSGAVDEEISGRLIVIGSRRSGRLRALLRGSVSRQLAKFGRTPVVIVPEDGRDGSRDGRPRSEARDAMSESGIEPSGLLR